MNNSYSSGEEAREGETLTDTEIQLYMYKRGEVGDKQHNEQKIESDNETVGVLEKVFFQVFQIFESNSLIKTSGWEETEENRPESSWTWADRGWLLWGYLDAQINQGQWKKLFFSLQKFGKNVLKISLN